MGDTLLLVVVFGAVVAVIWLSYRLFMRGDTNAERVASRLPPGFKPDWSWRCGDTYVGYEAANDRLAVVDYPQGAAVSPREVRSMEPNDESIMGIVHRWIIVSIAEPPKQLRVWFGLNASKRDATLARLKAILARAPQPE
jgi:hypothetical protein